MFVFIIFVMVSTTCPTHVQPFWHTYTFRHADIPSTRTLLHSLHIANALLLVHTIGLLLHPTNCPNIWFCSSPECSVGIPYFWMLELNTTSYTLLTPLIISSFHRSLKVSATSSRVSYSSFRGGGRTFLPRLSRMSLESWRTTETAAEFRLNSRAVRYAKDDEKRTPVLVSWCVILRWLVHYSPERNPIILPPIFVLCVSLFAGWLWSLRWMMVAPINFALWEVEKESWLM